MAKQPKRLGTLGWESILTVKDELLYTYKLAQKYSKNHSVQVHHGNVAEAVFRQMLGEFLPKRYGVTAGYIISQSLDISRDNKMSHFDVIIYDQLESPVLWIEKSPDSTEGGANRAIPAEYVVAVLEVKSSFTPYTVKVAINKLKELKKLMEVDEPNERYRKYLPTNFCCGTVFFELKKQHRKKAASLKNNLEGFELRNYRGAVILEAEGLNEPFSARINLGSSDTPIDTIQTIGSDLLRMQICGYPQPDKDGRYNCVSLRWSHVEFTQFLFELIAIWNGSYDGRAPTFHGLSFINPDAD